MDFCHIFQAEAVLTANYAECLQRLAERSLIFFTIGCQSQGTFKGVKTTNTTQVLPYWLVIRENQVMEGREELIPRWKTLVTLEFVSFGETGAEDVVEKIVQPALQDEKVDLIALLNSLSDEFLRL